MKQQEPTPLERQARRLYQRASRELPPELAARLDQARHQALRQASPRRRLARLWWPATALGMACALLLLWQPNWHASPASPAASSPVAPPAALNMDGEGELPPDTAQNDADLYQDLGFYRWLAAGQAPSANR